MEALLLFCWDKIVNEGESFAPLIKELLLMQSENQIIYDDKHDVWLWIQELERKDFVEIPQ